MLSGSAGVVKKTRQTTNPTITRAATAAIRIMRRRRVVEDVEASVASGVVLLTALGCVPGSADRGAFRGADVLICVASI
jgi:hypothetical protein